MPGTRPGMTSQTVMPELIGRYSSQTLRTQMAGTKPGHRALN
jgi:hypothetical protein